jgi:hypothetical protein
MHSRQVIGRRLLSLLFISALAACGDDSTSKPSGTGGMLVGTGGMLVGTGGTLVGTGGTLVGTGGTLVGTGGTVTGTGGTVAGTGGMATGTGGMATGTGGTVMGTMTVEECTAKVMAAGTTITACETCMCQPANCQTQLTAIDGDANANAMIKCIKEKMCTGLCCVCGNTATKCDIGTYGMGLCAAAFETAAGLTPGAGAIANGTKLGDGCKDTATTSCGKAAALGKCQTDKCKTECMGTAPVCNIPTM